jgi:hypothetical protein
MGAYALEIGSSTGFATLAGATETGTVITGFGNATAAVASGFASGGISGGNIESAIAGAVSAAAFFAAGSIAGAATDSGIGGFGQGEAGRVALHAVAGCASGAAAGGSCGRQAAAGAFSEAAGPIIAAGGDQFAYRVVAHSVAGGFGSMAAGGKFENGAATGAFGYLFNELGHPKQRGYEPTRYDDGTWCNAQSACSNWSGRVDPAYPVEGVAGGWITGKAAYSAVIYGAQIAGEASLSDFVRWGPTTVSKQIAEGPGAIGAERVWSIKGGGTNPETGFTLPYHFHVHKYNWYRPWTWFEQTPIIKR